MKKIFCIIIFIVILFTAGITAHGDELTDELGIDMDSIQSPAAEDYGTLTVTLRPLEVGTETPAGGSFSYEDSTDAVARIRTENVFVRFRFAVETAASLDGESWACSDAYSCAESYRLRFAWGGVPLYWADGWYTDSSCTVPFLPQGEDLLISYDYDTDCVTAVQFLPKAEEGGGGA